MGLLDKLETRRRVEPVTAPVNASLPMTPWLAGSAIPLGALIRTVVFKRGTTGMSSSLRRGRTPALGALLFDPTKPTRMRVETRDFRIWNFALGAKTLSGWSYDWEVRLSIKDGSATVETTRWLSDDGKLANGQYHDRFRQELLRVVSTGTVAGLEYEGIVSVGSRELPVAFLSPVIERADVEFSIITTLTRERLVNTLRALAFRTTAEGNTIRWGLGLPREDQSDFAVGTLTPEGVTARAQITSTSAVSRRVAEHGLRTLLDLTSTALKNLDQDARVIAPREWVN